MSEKPEKNSAVAPARERLWTGGFALVCILNFLNFGGMWMLPSMLPVFIRDLGAPEYMLGWIVGITSLATIITRPLAGLAVNRFGRRGVYIVGCAGMVATCLAFTIAPILAAVLAIRFIQGLAWGFTNTACTTIGSDSIVKSRYAEGMGYFTLASSVAMVISPALSLVVFYAVGGTAALLICAGFFALALLCSCFVSYIKLPRYQKPQGRPRRSLAVFIKDSLLEKGALPAAFLMLLTACSYGLVQSFAATMMEERGFNGASAFFLIMALAALVARPVFGRWADKRNYLEPALAAFVAMAASMVLMAFMQGVPLMVASAVLQGIGYSAGFSLFMALATVGVKPSRRGSAIATVMVGFDIGSGFSAVALGFLVATGGFTAIFICGAVISAVGILVVLAQKRRLILHHGNLL